MGCSLSTRYTWLCVFTILFFAVGVYNKISFLGVLAFYFALSPCMCCWIASDEKKSDEPHLSEKKKSDEPRFPYNRHLRSIYPAPDPSLKEKMAERALELENVLEGSKTPIEVPLIPKGSTAKSSSQTVFQLNDSCELSVEVTLDVETILTQCQKLEEKCYREERGTFQKESGVDEGGKEESSMKEDEHQEFSSDKKDVEQQEGSLDDTYVELHKFRLDKTDVELQKFSLDKTDVEQQKFSLDKRDEKPQEFSLDKVPLEFLYTQGY